MAQRGPKFILDEDEKRQVVARPAIILPPDTFLSHSELSFTAASIRLIAENPMRSRQRLIIHNRSVDLTLFVGATKRQLDNDGFRVIPPKGERTIDTSGRYHWWAKADGNITDLVDVHEEGRHELDVDPLSELAETS